jgi:hypothetical protein
MVTMMAALQVVTFDPAGASGHVNHMCLCKGARCAHTRLLGSCEFWTSIDGTCQRDCRRWAARRSTPLYMLVRPFHPR